MSTDRDPDSPTDLVHAASATADGSSATTDDGAVRVDVTTADARAEGATTPEHLMAAALAGCLQQAVVIAAGTLGQEVQPVVTATVSLSGSAGQGFSATFDLVVDGLEGDHADDLLAQARSICPFTTALEGRQLTVSRA